MKMSWQDTIDYEPLKIKPGDHIPRGNNANVLLFEFEQKPSDRDASDCRKLSEFTQ